MADALVVGLAKVPSEDCYGAMGGAGGSEEKAQYGTCTDTLGSTWRCPSFACTPVPTHNVLGRQR